MNKKNCVGLSLFTVYRRTTDLNISKNSLTCKENAPKIKELIFKTASLGQPVDHDSGVDSNIVVYINQVEYLALPPISRKTRNPQTTENLCTSKQQSHKRIQS